ncbi:hypothetical protein HK104_001342 [Borealophlyctis nickersoniae]|nr:hypothetical protein HK104_001342 [Borealophlyctis nickersoniae]
MADTTASAPTQQVPSAKKPEVYLLRRKPKDLPPALPFTGDQNLLSTFKLTKFYDQYARPYRPPKPGVAPSAQIPPQYLAYVSDLSVQVGPVKEPRQWVKYLDVQLRGEGPKVVPVEKLSRDQVKKAFTLGPGQIPDLDPSIPGGDAPKPPPPLKPPTIVDAGRPASAPTSSSSVRLKLTVVSKPVTSQTGQTGQTGPESPQIGDGEKKKKEKKKKRKREHGDGEGNEHGEKKHKKKKSKHHKEEHGEDIDILN